LLVTAQQITNVAVAVATNAISGFPLTSPWAVAISSSNIVYFSNFGGADSLDFIGSIGIDNANAQKLLALADLNNTLTYMLVKNLATNGTTVYAAVYGGPSGTSFILKCPNGAGCTVLVTIKDANGSTWIPTAVAYSTSMSRLFYAVADGNLQNSYISSVTDDGTVQSYITQSTSGCEYPVGLAVDDVNSLLFWANDVGSNKIVQGALAITASDIGTILQNAYHPQSIAVDTAAQYVYFTDQTSTPNLIARVRYGTGQYDSDFTILLSAMTSPPPSTPTGIAISMSKQYVYWADTGSSSIMRGSVADIGNQAPVTKKSNAVALTSSFATLIMCICVSIMLL